MQPLRCKRLPADRQSPRCTVNSYDEESPCNELSVLPSETWRVHTHEKSGSYYTGFTDHEEATYLSRPYLFFPINFSQSHWILALVSGLSDFRQRRLGGTPEIKLVIFDSQGGRYPEVTKEMKRWVSMHALPMLGFTGAEFRISTFYPEVLLCPPLPPPVPSRY